MDIQTMARKQHIYNNVTDKYLKDTHKKYLRNSTVGNQRYKNSAWFCGGREIAIEWPSKTV